MGTRIRYLVPYHASKTITWTFSVPKVLLEGTLEGTVFNIISGTLVKQRQYFAGYVTRMLNPGLEFSLGFVFQDVSQYNETITAALHMSRIFLFVHLVEAFQPITDTLNINKRTYI